MKLIKAVKSRWVINRSEVELSESQHSLLSRGLNFAIAPTKIPTFDFVTSIEKACKHIGPNTEEASMLRSDCVKMLKSCKTPPSNISTAEREALESLQANKDIMILPADKGRAVVVLDKSEYLEKAHTLLSDTNTYKKLPKDPTNMYTKRVVDVIKPLKDNGILPVVIYRRIYPTMTESPKFYGLPKIHKPEVPLRPIVASRGSITYELAKYVAHILAPIVGKTEHHIHNSADLVEKLKNVRLTEEETLVSYDVSALFTSVPVQESVDIIRKRLEDDDTLKDRTPLTPDQVTDLLSVCLTTTYFRFDNTYYIQTEGAAMGSPVSPIVANLFMEHFEQQALTSYSHPPRIWGRYVDDTITIIHKDHIDSFTNHINSIHPSIKFTTEHEHNHTLAMLDTLISRKQDGSLSFSIYRKPTHTDHYLQFSSHQPTEHKLGVIRTLTHRANTLVTEEEEKQKEVLHLKKVLSISGYPKWAWDLPGSTKITPHPRTKDPARRPKGHVTIPYVGGVSEALVRKMRKAGVTAHVRPQNTIRSHLVRPKDKEDNIKRCGVVYSITCEDCDTEYIGETERALNKRLSEHRRESSPVGLHMNEQRHKFQEKEVKIVDRESRWFERGVREAIHIRSRSPSLNRDQGRHLLPPIYNSIIPLSRDAGLQTSASSRD